MAEQEYGTQTGKPDEMSIEETFEAIDGLIGKLEDGEDSLEESFRDYEEGIRLIKSCSEKIEKIERQIQVLSGAEEDGDEGQL